MIVDVMIRVEISMTTPPDESTLAQVRREAGDAVRAVVLPLMRDVVGEHKGNKVVVNKAFVDSTCITTLDSDEDEDE